MRSLAESLKTATRKRCTNCWYVLFKPSSQKKTFNEMKQCDTSDYDTHLSNHKCMNKIMNLHIHSLNSFNISFV